MAKFFTLTDIRQKRIPTKEDISAVTAKIMEIKEWSDITDMLIYGTVAREQHTWRSDIDIICICKDATYNYHLNQYACRSASFEKKLGVVVNASFLSESLVKEKMHGFSSSMLYNAERYNLLIKGNPIGKMKRYSSDESYQSPKMTVLGHIEDKVRSYSRGMSQYPGMTNGEQMRFFERMYCAPLHLVRNLLWANGVAYVDTREKLIAQFTDVVKDKKQPFDILDQIAIFHRANCNHGEFVEFFRGISKNPSKNEYLQHVRRLYETLSIFPDMLLSFKKILFS